MVENLTQDQLRSLKEVFLTYDKDGSGTLTIDEFVNGLKPLGKPPTSSEIEDVIHVIDQDGDGEIDYLEFVTLIGEKINEDDMEQELETAYISLAKNLESNISKEKLRKIFKQMKEDVTEKDMRDLFETFGIEGEEITHDEFVRFMLAK